MKKHLINLLSVAGAMVLLGCSSTYQVNPTPGEQKSSKSTEERDFEYERKIKEAYNKGFKDGSMKGSEQAISIIRDEYAPQIKRMEAGKYAIKKGYITPPEVMVVQNPDGSMSYRTTGCKIEKELNVDDIMKRFGPQIQSSKADLLSVQDSQDITSESSSYKIAPRDISKASVQRPNHAEMSMIAKIPSTAANKMVLDEYNVRYSEKEGVFQAVFSSKEEMDGFCGQFHLCVE